MPIYKALIASLYETRGSLLIPVTGQLFQK